MQEDIADLEAVGKDLIFDNRDRTICFGFGSFLLIGRWAG